MAKRKNKANYQKKKCTITYNSEKPNRQARRLGIKPIKPKKEEPKKVSRAAVLSEKIQQAKEREKRIVPQGMTYGEYMDYLKDKRQQLEEKKTQNGL